MSGQDQVGRQRYIKASPKTTEERCHELTEAAEEFCDRVEEANMRYRLFCQMLERDPK